MGTEELDLLVPKFLPVAIKLAFALRAGHPKYFCHVCLLVLLHRDAKFAEFGIFPKEKTLSSASSAPPAVNSPILSARPSAAGPKSYVE
jgi:hypothetical protein